MYKSHKARCKCPRENIPAESFIGKVKSYVCLRSEVLVERQVVSIYSLW